MNAKNSVFTSKSAMLIKEVNEFLEPAKLNMIKSDILANANFLDTLEEKIESAEDKFNGIDSDDFDETV